MRTNSVPTIALLVAAAGTLFAAELTAPVRAPRFSDYPFDQWAAEPEHSAIKWQIHLEPPQLSVHQRLMERVQAIVPGAELDKRRGRGELVLLIRFEDSDGRQWRSGSRLNLVKVQAGVKSQELTFNVEAFVRPGDYKVLAALIDSKTMEHSFTRRTLHVAPLKNDPLPQAWFGLPPVEVIPVVDIPEAWSLPEIKGRLKLPVPAQSAIAPRIDLLVNMTPSEHSLNPASAMRRNMSVVIPALKVLSGLNAEIQPPSAAVIDLTRQRIALATTDAATLDWNAFNKMLKSRNPDVIDAKSLAIESGMHDYFAREAARRAGDSGPLRWLIVLSGPLTFGKQNETPLPQLPPDPNRHIVYLRFLSQFRSGPMGARPGPPGPIPGVQIAPPERVRGPIPGLATTLPGGIGGPGRGRGEMLFPDDLERILKPMGAQIITVATPESFRKTIAALITQIATPQSAAN